MGKITDTGVRTALKGQYHAALAMLRESVELCPDELWLDETPRNAFWRVAYHALFFVHLYLMDTPEEFVPWAGHQSDVQQEDGIEGPADPESSLPVSPNPYSKADVLTYLGICSEMVDARVEAMDLGSESSGFYWYPISKLEHQLVNIRHTAHHAAQLADRVRAARDIGVKWVGSGRGRGATDGLAEPPGEWRGRSISVTPGSSLRIGVDPFASPEGSGTRRPWHTRWVRTAM